MKETLPGVISGNADPPGERADVYDSPQCPLRLGRPA